MKRYYKSLLSFFMSAVIASCALLPTINSYASEKLIYTDLSLVPDGKISETGYLSEKWVDQKGEEVTIESPEKSTSLIPNKGTALPEYYSSVNNGYVTSIKNQQSTNTCWAFSAIAVAESSLLKKGVVSLSDEESDLSEAHLVWFTHKSLLADESDPTYGDGTNMSSPYSLGGYWLRSTFALARGSGFALEKDYPYYANNASMMGNYPLDARYDSKFTLDKAYLIPNTETDAIKKVIMNEGSITAALYISTAYLNKGDDGYAYYQNYSLDTNHQVAIVGWDDSFAVDNFKAGTRPSAPGAWLVKNSYGTTFGDNGYFWISYEEPSLKHFAAEEVSVTNENENIYQYDGYGYGTSRIANTSAGNPVQVASQANVFTAQTHEMINAVSFYTIQGNVEYTIEIYTDVTPNMSSPTVGGIKADSVTSGVINYGGYHKIPLSRGVTVNAGESFAVVVTLSVSGDVNLYLPFEGASGTDDGILTRYYSSSSGQSYYHFADSAWIEASGNEKLNNVCIKAFTEPDNSLEISTAEEFNAFAESVSNGTTYEGKNVNLVNDIDFEGGEIIPVGTKDNPFCGYFLGNGHVLRNGVINSETDYCGIFSELSENSAITKLGAENITLDGANGVGIICGESHGTIKYCYSTGSVSGDSCVGGLVGINYGEIYSSYSVASVSGMSSAGLLVGANLSGNYDLCVTGMSEDFNPVGNAQIYEIVSFPEKSFVNGQVAFYLDNGSDKRNKVWTKNNGITTFAKSDDDLVYEIELYSPSDHSSLYLYARPDDDLISMALEEKPDYSVTIYADPRCSVLFTGVPNANMMLYAQWEKLHKCADELTFVSEIPADCYTSGAKAYYECSCGELYEDEDAAKQIILEDTVVQPLNHPDEYVEKTDAVQPTHVADGNIEYYTCTLCGGIFSNNECTIRIEETVVPATGHSYGGWITETEAECETDGYKYKLCSCGDKLTETIPAEGHEYSSVITPPTYTEQGYTTYTCSKCSDSYISDYIDPLSKVNVSGTVKSYLSETDEITIELIKQGEEESSYSVTVTGNSTDYSFENIWSGVYTVRVSKNNHATLEYQVIVGAEGETLDLKINPVGDANGDGKITVTDYVKVLQHAKGVTKMTDYAFSCGDVDSNGKIAVADYVKVLQHAKGTNLLW